MSVGLDTAVYTDFRRVGRTDTDRCQPSCLAPLLRKKKEEKEHSHPADSSSAQCVCVCVYIPCILGSSLTPFGTKSVDQPAGSHSRRNITQQWSFFVFPHAEITSLSFIQVYCGKVYAWYKVRAAEFIQGILTYDTYVEFHHQGIIELAHIPKNK